MPAPAPSLELDVLRAFLRLARRRVPPTTDQLLLRVPANAPLLKKTLSKLIEGGLVNLTPKGPRLSLTGFAVAVAFAPQPRAVTRLARTRTEGPAPLRRRPAA